MKRKIINIDEEKCTGCGQCIPDCPEGALQHHHTNKNHLTFFHPHFCTSTKITDLRAPLPTRLGLQKFMSNFLNDEKYPTAAAARANYSE